MPQIFYLPIDKLRVPTKTVENATFYVSPRSLPPIFIALIPKFYLRMHLLGFGSKGQISAIPDDLQIRLRRSNFQKAELLERLLQISQRKVFCFCRSSLSWISLAFYSANIQLIFSLLSFSIIYDHLALENSAI